MIPTRVAHFRKPACAECPGGGAEPRPRAVCIPRESIHTRVSGRCPTYRPFPVTYSHCSARAHVA
eukprot:6700633-Prymnesium_polylepis.1